MIIGQVVGSLWSADQDPGFDGQPLRLVPEAVLATTAAQYVEAEKVGEAERIALHFNALKRILDRREPDYAT